jgi:hypothetical protein
MGIPFGSATDLLVDVDLVNLAKHLASSLMVHEDLQRSSHAIHDFTQSQRA